MLEIVSVIGYKMNDYNSKVSLAVDGDLNLYMSYSSAIYQLAYPYNSIYQILYFTCNIILGDFVLFMGNNETNFPIKDGNSPIFNQISSLTMDNYRNVMYVADNRMIRKICLGIK